MGLVSALMWVAQVKQAQPQQVQGQNGIEWHCPALVGKKVGLFLQKVLYTKNDGGDGYKFEVRHVFQPGTVKPTPSTLKMPRQKRSPRLNCR